MSNKQKKKGLCVFRKSLLVPITGVEPVREVNPIGF